MTDEHAVERVVSTELLAGLVREGKATALRSKNITGPFADSVKRAVENGHLDKFAFTVVNRLNKKDELDRNGHIRSIKLYIDKLLETEWAEEAHVGDFAEMANRAGAKLKAEAKEAKAQARANKAAIKAGIKQLEPPKPYPGPSDGQDPADLEPGVDMKNAAAAGDAFLKEEIEKRKAKALPGADAPGTYSVQ